MTSVVISERHGGFGLSDEATRAYLSRTGHEWTEEQGRYSLIGTVFKVSGEDNWYDRDIPRDDPDLVAVVREMGAAANTRYSSLVVVEVPDDAEWYVDEYDGYETVHEKHRSWSSDGERVLA